MSRFVHRRNIERYADRLEADVDPTQRSVFMRLMIEEEDRFGHRVEALDLANRRLASARELITRQQVLVDRLAQAGEDTGQENLLLAQLLDLYAVFEAYRDEILDALQK